MPESEVKASGAFALREDQTRTVGLKESAAPGRAPQVDTNVKQSIALLRIQSRMNNLENMIINSISSDEIFSPGALPPQNFFNENIQASVRNLDSELDKGTPEARVAWEEVKRLMRAP